MKGALLPDQGLRQYAGESVALLVALLYRIRRDLAFLFVFTIVVRYMVLSGVQGFPPQHHRQQQPRFLTRRRAYEQAIYAALSFDDRYGLLGRSCGLDSALLDLSWGSVFPVRVSRSHASAKLAAVLYITRCCRTREVALVSLRQSLV